MVKISVEPDKAWAYFHKHKEELRSIMHRIAENEEFGVEIFITEDADLPCIVVTADNTQVYEESAVTEKDCKQTVKEVYEKYLTDKVVTTISDQFDSLTPESIEEIIDTREFELDCAVSDFLTVVLDSTYIDEESIDFTEVCDDLKEHFLEYMARKHNLPVYRPMYLEYEDGSEEFEEYPYDNMVFDDEDNPIYKS